MRFPSIKDVAHDLRISHQSIDWTDGDDCDVRLQVYEDGSWAVRVGPSDYDLDHRGFWGASSIPRGRFRSTDVARDLIEQAKNQYACFK